MKVGTILFFLLKTILATDSVLGPEQIHISIGKTPETVFISWVSKIPTYRCSVLYGTEPSPSKFKDGNVKLFVDGGKNKTKRYMSYVELTGLKHNTKYNYKVGNWLTSALSLNYRDVSPADIVTWSRVMSFKTLPSNDDENWVLRLALIGDMGVENAVSLNSLLRESNEGNFDLILHDGDFAYDMDVNEGNMGDDYMNMIEPFASKIPYQPAVGNHENAYNFSHYKYRFTTEGGSGDSMFYSFNVGKMHIISFSSEFYYYVSYGWEQIIRQFDWLKKDLEEANRPENREKHPWIMAMAHRPMYCSNNDDDQHCAGPINNIRDGIVYDPNGNHPVYLYSPEELFYENGVDIIIGAHEHSYERMFPVYKSKVCNGTVDKKNPYHTPRAPIHFVTGSGGCREKTDPFYKHPWKYSAFHSDDYGYSRMHVYNNTHILWEQISAENGTKVIDSAMIVKEHHGANKYTCYE